MSDPEHAALCGCLWSTMFVTLIAATLGDVMPDWLQALAGWSLGPLFIAAVSYSAWLAVLP